MDIIQKQQQNTRIYAKIYILSNFGRYTKYKVIKINSVMDFSH